MTQDHELVERLRRECLEDRDGDTNASTIEEQLLDQLPAFVEDLVASDEVENAVEVMISTDEYITPDNRRHLIEAAQRATRSHQNSPRALQLVLEEARVELGLDTAAIANHVGVNPAQIEVYEAGNEPLIHLEPDKLARWVDQLNIPTDLARVCVVRSLALAGSPRGYSRNPASRQPTQEANAYIERFIETLDALRRD